MGELGSISAAAEAIGLSQPALTQGIARLERQFGTHLFDRLAQGLRPTENGAKVLSRTGRAVERLARALRTAARPGRLGAGRQGIRPELHLTAAQVRAVLALAEAGSLSAAAQAIGLSEPAVHRAVRELERTCNVVLTEHRGRSVCLSETGRRMARGFTIALDIPYDRPNTTMKSFPLCPLCRREYGALQDRRFHAQAQMPAQVAVRIFGYRRQQRIRRSSSMRLPTR